MKKLMLFLLLALLIKAESPAQLSSQGMPKRGGTWLGGWSFSGTNYYGMDLQDMTTAQATLLGSPASGSYPMIFNTDSAKAQIWNGSSWTTVGSGGGGGGGGSFTAKESDVSVGTGITTIDFGTGFDLTVSPAGEVNIAPDYTENPTALAAFSTINLGTLAVQNGQIGFFNASSSFRQTVSSLPQVSVNKILSLPVQSSPIDTVATQAYARSVSGATHTGDVLGTSQEITLTGTGADQIQSDVTWSLASSLSLAGKTTFLVPQSTNPSATLAGAFVFDTDRLAPSRGAFIGYDGSSRGFVPLIQNSETPADGDYPRYNPDGTFTLDPGVSMNVALNTIPYATTANTALGSSLYYSAVVDTNPIFAAGYRTSISPALTATSVFEGAHAKGNTNILLRAYDNTGDGGVTQYIGYAIGGTPRNPSATPSNTVMTRLAGRGYGSTAEVALSKAQVNLLTTQSWTDTHNGTKIQFVVTPNNSTTTGAPVEITSNGLEVLDTYNMRIYSGANTLTLAPLTLKGNRTVGFSDMSGNVLMTTLTTNSKDSVNSMWGTQNGLNFEGATADANEGILTPADPTHDNTWTLPDTSFTVFGSTLSTNRPEVANGVWGVSNGLRFEGATNNTFETTITPTDPTADNVITIPDQSGTMAVRIVKIRTSDTTTTSSTPVNLNGEYFTAETNKYYRIIGTIGFTTSNTGCGLILTLTASNVTILHALVNIEGIGIGDGVGSNWSGQINSSADAVTSTGVTAASPAIYTATIAGIVQLSSSGNVQLQFGAEDNTNTITIKAGSVLIAEQLN